MWSNGQVTKLVKIDSAVESASREFSARLTKMLGVPEASNVPGVVRPRPTGPKVALTLGLHSANLYGIRTEIGMLGNRFIVFDMEILASTSMPVLGLVDYRMAVEPPGGNSTAMLALVRRALESVGMLEKFLASEGKEIVCSKQIEVSCVDKLLRNGKKIMSVQMKAYENA